MSTKKLDVYLNKVFAGIFEQDLSGKLFFTYDQDFLKSRNPQPLSASLPLQESSFSDKIVRPFFSSLLPEGTQLELVAKNLKSSQKNPFALLFQIGRDCAGAVEIMPQNQEPPSYEDGSLETLSEEKLYQILSDIHSNPLLAGNKKMRLSLAGAQSKLAVFFDERKKSLPKLVKDTPSTHILKPAIPNLLDSVHNEFFCMKLAKEIEFDVAEVFFKTSKDRPYLLVRRYDRTKLNSHIIRIHQEDFCQTLGLPPEQKYQGIDGGPSIKICLDLIEKYGSFVALDKLRFIQSVIFNYLIGNSDAHGKNFSFLYTNGQTRLAPFYDLISTNSYSKLQSRMAMKIGKSHDPERTLLVHWHDIVADTNTARTHLNKELKSFATKLPRVAENLKQQLAKQGIESEVFDVIIKLINKRASRILGYFKD